MTALSLAARYAIARAAFADEFPEPDYLAALRSHLHVINRRILEITAVLDGDSPVSLKPGEVERIRQADEAMRRAG